ncbi:MAG: copper resistance protein B [Steroidobacteraceae bacterium]
MAEMMRMDDTERYGRVTVDQLEWQDASHADIAWDAQAFYGGDYHKLWLKTEGVHEQDENDVRIEALWNDPARRIGSGLSDIEAGLRLRYEVRREFAPYIGVHWVRRFGETADLAGDDRSDTRFVAGLRVWF